MRAIPDDNLKYPVLVRESGSGFYLHRGDNVYFITAKHVLYKNKEEGGGLRKPLVTLLSYANTKSKPDEFELVIDLPVLEASGNIAQHETADIVAVKIGKAVQKGQNSFDLTFIPGILLKKGSSGLVFVKGTKSFDEVLVANEVFMLGYPISISGQDPILKEIQDYPLLRKGIVAGKNEISKLIILDCPAYQGNSGGPVIEIENEKQGTKMMVIGVVSSFVPFVELTQSLHYKYVNKTIENSGYSVVVPIEAAFEIIKSKFGE